MRRASPLRELRLYDLSLDERQNAFCDPFHHFKLVRRSYYKLEYGTTNIDVMDFTPTFGAAQQRPMAMMAASAFMPKLYA